MNLPNKLTVLRIVMAPLFLLLTLWDFPGHYAVALVVFVLAALTDMLDGRIARSRQLVTNFGKFLDPLADKMLTTAAFLSFLANGKLSVWALMIILTREFMVTSVRLIAAKDGNVIAANGWGKTKTVAQYVAVIYTLAFLQVEQWGWFSSAVNGVLFGIATALLWISVVLTAYSGGYYVWQCRGYFTGEK